MSGVINPYARKRPRSVPPTETFSQFVIEATSDNPQRSHPTDTDKLQPFEQVPEETAQQDLSNTAIASAVASLSNRSVVARADPFVLPSQAITIPSAPIWLIPEVYQYLQQQPQPPQQSQSVRTTGIVLHQYHTANNEFCLFLGDPASTPQTKPQNNANLHKPKSVLFGRKKLKPVYKPKRASMHATTSTAVQSTKKAPPPPLSTGTSTNSSTIVESYAKQPNVVRVVVLSSHATTDWQVNDVVTVIGELQKIDNQCCVRGRIIVKVHNLHVGLYVQAVLARRRQVDPF